MVPQGDGLGGLQMGEARHHGVGMGERRFGERALVGGQAGVEAVDGIAHPQAEVGRDLVVARARGVQTAGRCADQFGEPRLDIHVDVLERALEGERAGLHF